MFIASFALSAYWVDSLTKLVVLQTFKYLKLIYIEMFLVMHKTYTEKKRKKI